MRFLEVCVPNTNKYKKGKETADIETAMTYIRVINNNKSKIIYHMNHNNRLRFHQRRLHCVNDVTGTNVVDDDN